MGRMRETRCAKCGAFIDKSACGQAFAIITVKDDTENNPEKYKKERFYLCDNCVPSLRLFLLNV